MRKTLFKQVFNSNGELRPNGMKLARMLDHGLKPAYLKAKDISGQAPGGQRTRLADVVPLDTPYVVQIFPIYACNFKCNYCLFSVDKAKRSFISDKAVMDFSLFKKCVDDMAGFPVQIRTFRFVGIGEPLLHSDILKMVGYAKNSLIAQRVELLTNASLLTPYMSDGLRGAGLDRMVVSIQGTNAKRYREVSGVDIDFGSFLDNLRYFFHRRRKKTQLYIKTVDTALEGEDDRSRFYELFGPICDTIAIEHTVPIHSGIEYDGVLKDSDPALTQFGLPVADVKVCPQPFFTMQINPDGKVVPCYSFEYPLTIGDCNSESAVDIWSGAKFQQFRRLMVEGLKDECQTCKACKIIKHRMFPEDNLDADAGRLKEFYQ